VAREAGSPRGGQNSKRGAIPKVGNTAEGHRISARNETSRPSARGVAAGETRSALREVTARREHPATSREALCGGSKPLNEQTRATSSRARASAEERALKSDEGRNLMAGIAGRREPACGTRQEGAL